MAKNTITSKKTLQRSYKNKQQKNIKIAIAGIGNCSSALVQGLFYYKNINSNDNLVPGLMHNVLGNYKISDIKPVAAFDIDKRKVGKDLSEAIFALPNCTKTFCKNIPKIGVKVKMGPILDGVADHMKNYPEEKTFVVAKEKPVDVVKELKNSAKNEVLKIRQEIATCILKEEEINYTKGLAHGFWIQQLANAELCLFELEQS